MVNRSDSERLRGFCDWRTDWRTFAILESLSRLKIQHYLVPIIIWLLLRILLSFVILQSSVLLCKMKIKLKFMKSLESVDYRLGQIFLPIGPLSLSRIWIKEPKLRDHLIILKCTSLIVLEDWDRKGIRPTNIAISNKSL